MNTDRVSSLFWLAVALLAVYGSVHLGVGTLREPGSGFLAFLAGGFIGLMAILVFIQTFFRGKEFQQQIVVLWKGVAWHRPLVIALLMVGYILVLERIGFLLSSLLIILIMLRGLERLSWIKAISVSFAASAVSYLLFGVLLSATLPKGIFGF